MRIGATNFVLASGLAAAAVGLAAPALAQEAQPSEEIIVTAQRYEQRLQDVPASVSVLSGRTLDDQGAGNLEDVQFSVPGLSANSYAPGYGFIQLRGVASNLGSATVGQYFNEMPITGDVGQGTLDIRTFDLARVEVLRGPQPTLYGESSMGGALHYVPAAPDLQNYSTAFEAETGAVQDGEQSYRANAVLNLALGHGVVGLRLSGQYERDGGWIDDLPSGRSDINRSTVGTVRATLLVRPDANTDFTLVGMHQELDQLAQNFGTNRVSNAVAPEFDNDDYDLVNGVLRHDFGGVDFTYSLGFIDRHQSNSFDISAFYIPVLDAPFPFGFGFPVGYITEIGLLGDTNFRIVTNEARLSSRQNGLLDWTIGAYSRSSDSHELISDETGPNPAGFVLVGGDTRRKSDSWAIYGDATLHLSPALSLLVGARYYEDHKTFASSLTNFGFSSLDNGDGTFSTFNPRLSVSYAFSRESMVYFNVAKGFRSGGFNSQAAGGGLPVPPTYSPDKLWSYEIGTHQQFLGGRLAFDGAVYYEDWRDVISSEFLGASTFTIITNGGQASGYGVDLSASYRPTDGLTLTGTYGWNNVEYTTTTADKNSGDPIDFAVQQSYSASLDYRRPVLGSVNGYARLDFQHADAAQITLRNFGGQVVPMPARNLVNVRLGVEIGSYDLSLFANNALDEDHPVIKAPFGVLTEDVEARPREIGVTLRGHF